MVAQQKGAAEAVLDGYNEEFDSYCKSLTSREEHSKIFQRKGGLNDCYKTRKKVGGYY